MRRRRQRLEDQLLSLTAGCVAVAGIWTWARLSPPATPPGGANGVLAFTLNLMARTVADALMPFVLVATPVLLVMWIVLIRRTRQELRKDQTAGTLRKLTPDRFEDWCAARFRDLGYQVQIVGGQGDHGIDLLASKGGEKVAVQCRRFAQANSVTEPQLRDLYGAMHAVGAGRAVMVTTGQYTGAASEWARGKSIDLWGPQELGALEPPVAGLSTQRNPGTTLGSCPISHSPLVLRTNRQSGDQFVGCSDYPKCRYTRPLTTVRSSSVG